jgi:general secretion pathway protein E
MTAKTDPAAGTPIRHVPPKGRLDMRQLLKWLRDDGLLAPQEADMLAKRFGQAPSSLHPLA